MIIIIILTLIMHKLTFEYDQMRVAFKILKLKYIIMIKTEI